MIKIGDIVVIKNICFQKKVIDHAFINGRPCIYIGDIDDRMYFCPLVNSSTSKNSFASDILPDKENGLAKVCHPNFKVLIDKPICYMETRGSLNEKETLRFFKNAIKYLKCIQRDSDKKILYLANDYIKNQVYKDDKNNKKKYNTKKTR